MFLPCKHHIIICGEWNLDYRCEDVVLELVVIIYVWKTIFERQKLVFEMKRIQKKINNK